MSPRGRKDTAISGIDRERLAKLLEMTSSGHDGEALGAIRGANKLLQRERVTWTELLSAPALPAPNADDHPKPTAGLEPEPEPFVPRPPDAKSMARDRIRGVPLFLRIAFFPVWLTTEAYAIGCIGERWPAKAGGILAAAFVAIMSGALWAFTLKGIVTAVAPKAFSQTIVVDGDTIKIDGTPYRLWGIDAPETKQWCGDYPAGIQAAATLAYLIKDKTVTCERRSTDRYGRVVAVCWAAGFDTGREMARLGMAWAFSRYSLDYVQDEAAAKDERLGIHAHGCRPAWEWRAERRGAGR